MNLEYFMVFASFFIYSTTGSALHGRCLSNEDCGTIDTYCQNETCVCKENFAVWYDSCIHLASPRITCKKRYDCQSLGVKSMCTRNSLCACKPFHHLHLGQCVKNRDLNDICEHSHQCYCGEDCEDKIACIGRNCSCKPGHKPYRSRRCILYTAEEQLEMEKNTATKTWSDVNSQSAISSTATISLKSDDPASPPFPSSSDYTCPRTSITLPTTIIILLKIL